MNDYGGSAEEHMCMRVWRERERRGGLGKEEEKRNIMIQQIQALNMQHVRIHQEEKESESPTHTYTDT